MRTPWMTGTPQTVNPLEVNAMRYLLAAVVVLLPLAVGAAEKKADREAKVKHVLTMSLDDKFTVADTTKWKVTVEKELALRFANVKVEPKEGAGFSLVLYFKCDTPDLAQFDSPPKIERAVRASSNQYLSNTVEKTIVLKKLAPKGWYGCYTVLTDASLADKTTIPENEFKYITRGMIRLSQNSALGFSLMTNDVDDAQYKEIIRYILSFAKPKK
jgi:hypothetical protein